MAGTKIALRAAREQVLTYERLREVLEYDPETGVFRAKIQSGRRAAGTIAGFCNGKHGYRAIAIDGQVYYSHRLAWLYTHGVWPYLLIDHIDNVTSNNRISNLREATPSQNVGNRLPRKDGRKVRGVRKRTDMSSEHPWEARSKDFNRWVHLGFFATEAEASVAYETYAKARWGEYLR